MNEKERFKLYGVDWRIFAICGVIVLAATYMGVLPKGMIGAFPIMIVVGTVLNEIGNRLPVIKSYLGGGAIVIIFVSAAFGFYNILPKATVDIITNFMKGEGFLDFYIAALITGSILGMSRSLLIKAAIRYLPAILGGVVCALGLAGIVGFISGYGATKAVFFIAIPIMGGGMGAGAVPLSQIFGGSLGVTPESILSTMIPAVALGNAMSIIAGGLLNRLGKVKPKLCGNGQMLISLQANQAAEQDALANSQSRGALNLTDLGVGILVSTTFMSLGIIISKFVPSIHYYAWMILSVAVCKALGIIPDKIENACYQWFQFIMKNMTSVLLVGIGIAYTDLGEIISAFTPIYLLLVFVVVVGAILGAGIMGRVVGFFPIEASITAGLCMANMGGTGDVAVLSAAQRMELMPFAQISSRLGGAFMLVLSSVLLKMFM